MSKISPASRLLTQTARDVLRPLGLKQHGSSRIWLDDHNWWLVVVEFQSATSIQGSYLNVGAMWLWRSPAVIGFDTALASSVRVRDHIDYRDDTQFTKAARSLATTAADQVEAYREHFSTLPAVAEHLESRLTRKSTIWDWYHAAVAAGMLGDVKRSRACFQKVLDDPDGKGASPFSWVTELQERVRRPYDMVRDSDAFRAWARDQILSCRGQLNLGSPTRAPFEPAEPLDRM
ncbi:hypothetical protein [Actinomadura bangladeshensis]|uniref:DUF4304 domain-containing protein n=1 Tax=Actinomadura bangladeshensis TaxID=453573 RepID=A0A6L9QNR7_9ACTN|nr:hypothetical protein [Actinomadura bangladeshensis]NEA27131.1 hypothetical protein [Actinomadura bangladeshensis]